MNVWWDGLSSLQQVMFVIGSIMTLFMIAQIVMMIMGIGHDAGLDADTSGLSDAGASGVDADISLDHDFALEHDVDSAPHGAGCEHFHIAGLKLFSLRSIIVFFCFGAWVTFTMEYYVSWVFAALIGLAAGFVAAVIMAVIMKNLMKLQNEGNINIKNAVGLSGEVYLTIPAKRAGEGKVNVTVQERLTEFSALTDDDDSILTGEQVIVKSVTDDNLIVERIKDRNRQAKPN